MSFDWDTVHVTKRPAAKEVEVSFVKDDGLEVGSEAPEYTTSCMIWRGAYNVLGVGLVLRPDAQYFAADTGEDIYNANPHTVQLELDVYSEDAFVDVQWTDERGVNTKRLPVQYRTNGTGYVSEEIDFYITLADAQAIAGAAGVNEVGSVAITTTYTECEEQGWSSYCAAGSPCEHLYTTLTAVGPRPIVFSVNDCSLPPPDPDPSPEDGADVIPVQTPPECQPHDCQAYEKSLQDGMLLATDAQFETLYGTSTQPFQTGRFRMVNKSPISNNPSIMGGFDRPTIGDQLSSGPCDPAIRAFGVPFGGSSFRLTPFAPGQDVFWYDPSIPNTSRPSFSVGLNYTYDALVWTGSQTGDFTLFNASWPINFLGGSTSVGTGASLSWDRAAGTVAISGLGQTNAHSWTAKDVLYVKVSVQVDFTVGDYVFGGEVIGRSVIGSTKIAVSGDVSMSVSKSGSIADVFNTSYIVFGNNGMGSYPEAFSGAILLALGDASADASAAFKSIKDAEASLVSYTPPTYCARIP